MNKFQKLATSIITVAAVSAILYRLMRMRSRTKLFVIGNGFDLYHGIPSSYLKFGDYAKQNDPSVYEALEKYLYLQNDDEWNRFETNLANLDPDELLDEMKIYLGDPGGDWKDSMNHDFQYEVGKVTDSLSDKMQSIFLNWILQLDIIHLSTTPKLTLPKDELYLNFNYTNSLEKIYAIPEKNILYIHGKAKDPKSSIVLGHGWENFQEATQAKPITFEDFVDGNYSTEEDWQMTEAKEDIQNYFANSFKNAKKIIQENRNFFRRLRQVKEIYVMGHSMSAVDRKYFEALAKNISAGQVTWTVSYYKKEDVDNCTETLKYVGVDMRLVTFKRLEDFFSRQTTLF